MDDDLVLKPEWIPYTPVFKVFGEKGNFIRKTVDSIISSCPFSFLFQ